MSHEERREPFSVTLRWHHIRRNVHSTGHSVHEHNAKNKRQELSEISWEKLQSNPAKSCSITTWSSPIFHNPEASTILGAIIKTASKPTSYALKSIIGTFILQ